MLVERASVRTRWLNKLRPRAPHQAEGPDGPIAPVVTTGYYFCSKKNLSTLLDSCISSLRLSMQRILAHLAHDRSSVKAPCASSDCQDESRYLGHPFGEE